MRNGRNSGALCWTSSLGAMSGIELAQRLTAEGWRTPIIFVTAHDDPEARAQAEALGCAAFSKKRIPVKTCWRPFGG